MGVTRIYREVSYSPLLWMIYPPVTPCIVFYETVYKRQCQKGGVIMSFNPSIDKFTSQNGINNGHGLFLLSNDC